MPECSSMRPVLRADGVYIRCGGAGRHKTEGVVTLELRQEQKLKQTLSQNMLQSTEILQMGQLELKEYLEDLALENPVVDLDAMRGTEKTSDDKGESTEDFIRKLEELQSMDAQNRQYYQDEQDEASRFEPAEKQEMDLKESLLEQILYMKISKEEFHILEYMILNLDDNGYLTEELPLLCRELKIAEEEGERLLKVLWKLEPKGAGARNLRECLLIQLEGDSDEEKLARRIVEDYLEELGKNRMEVIARKLKCSIDQVLSASDRIRALNPRPGSGYGSGKYQKYLVPDVLVVKNEGHFEIIINDETYPKLSINPYYLTLMKGENSGEAAGYVKNKVKQAEWVCHCVEQRNRTLYLLVQEILKAQLAFFEEGRGKLTALTQRSIAEKLELNESTVSRAVREKYLQCQWGIFPLQFFFSRGSIPVDGKKKQSRENGSGAMSHEASGNDGAAGAGAEAVKEQIRILVAGEDKKKPYSDRILAEKLGEAGFSISRRTVAKYREAIGIADASGRKVFERKNSL